MPLTFCSRSLITAFVLELTRREWNHHKIKTESGGDRIQLELCFWTQTFLHTAFYITFRRIDSGNSQQMTKHTTFLDFTWIFTFCIHISG